MYRVQTNYCDCHPDECNCFDYAITKDGKVIAYGQDIHELLRIANTLNKAEVK